MNNYALWEAEVQRHIFLTFGHYMGVRGQLHDPAAIAEGKDFYVRLEINS
jgi:hypothetical protein